MRQVKIEQTDDLLAALVAEAEAGESLTLVRDGKPVAQIIPFPLPQQPPAHDALVVRTEPERLEAVQQLRALMNPGWDLGIVWNGRDELYDRD